MNNLDTKYYNQSLYDQKYSSSHREKYNRHRETNHESRHFHRLDRDKVHTSQSTLCAPYREKYPNKDVPSLPYYIVPVLYVPHKAMYEAKQVLEPNLYKAYHCRSKNQLHKDTKSPPKLSRSKSVLNLHNKINCKEKESCVPKNENYSFEYYDEYFRRFVEEKKSSSEISFCTDKSYCQLPSTPKLSSKFTDESFSPASEKRKSISKDFPELFGLQSSKTTACTFGPRTGEEEPTWDSPRTIDALIETERAVKCSMSAQTSFGTLKWRGGGWETKGTQTIIKDIQKNVLVLPREGVTRSNRKGCVTEEVPRKIYDGDKMMKKSFGFNRSSARLARSAMSNSFSPTVKSSRRSMDSVNTCTI